MESLGDILRRLQQQSTFEGTGYPEGADREGEAVEPACPLCGGRGWVYRDVPLGHADFGKAFPCQCQERLSDEQRLSRLQRFSNMGVLSRVSFAATDPEGRRGAMEARTSFRAAFDAAQRYAKDAQGWLTLVGASGTGKTHLAAAIANWSMETGTPVFFAVVPDLLDHLRASFSPDAGSSYDELFEQVKAVPLLVLDDLGAQSSTSWAQEKLFQVLNHRYVNMLPTVITTNMPLEQMEARLESRLTDPRVSQVVDLGAQGASRVTRLGAVEPTMLARMTFAAFEPQGRVSGADKEGRETLAAALTAAKSFAESPEGWLVLLGDTGCGKTHLAVAVVNERLKVGEEVFFTLVPDLLDHLRYTFSPDSHVTYDELFERVKRTSLLVLDDLGAESSTPWAHEKLYQIVVHRHNARLPTVITMRQLLEDPKDPVTSRLNDLSLVTIVPISAPDYRQQGRRPAAAPARSRSYGPRSQGR